MTTTDELIDIARGIASQARPGEQIEAYVVRSQQTDVEVFGGEVESLTTAGVEGVSVRAALKPYPVWTPEPSSAIATEDAEQTVWRELASTPSELASAASASASP